MLSPVLRLDLVSDQVFQNKFLLISRIPYMGYMPLPLYPVSFNRK